MANILDKETVQKVTKELKKYKDSIEVIELTSSARTADHAAKTLKTEKGSIVKSLLLRTRRSFLLCLIAGDKRCSLNKLKKILNEKDLSMASPEQVKRITGFTIGGVSPVGHLNKLDIYIDKTLKRYEDVFAAAGHPNSIFKIKFKDLCELTNGIIQDIGE